MKISHTYDSDYKAITIDFHFVPEVPGGNAQIFAIEYGSDVRCNFRGFPRSSAPVPTPKGKLAFQLPIDPPP
jgi:hypothetical protein